MNVGPNPQQLLKEGHLSLNQNYQAAANHHHQGQENKKRCVCVCTMYVCMSLCNPRVIKLVDIYGELVMYLGMCVCMYVAICEYTYVCMYVCMYVCINKNSINQLCVEFPQLTRQRLEVYVL